jgi:hypothetical protein
MSAVGALVVGIGFFAGPVQQAHASSYCSGCDAVIVTPATVTATAAAGTGGQYLFKVTNKDRKLRSLTFAAPADFVATAASGPSGSWVSALPASTVTLTLAGKAPSSFTVAITALAPCVAASPKVWAVSGSDLGNKSARVRWRAAPPSVSVTGTCSLGFTGQPAQTAVNSDILTGFNSTGSPLTVQLFDANGGALNPADFSATGTPVTVSIQTNPGAATLSGASTLNSSGGIVSFGSLQIDRPGAGYQLGAASPGFVAANSDFFTVAGRIQACTSTSCSASTSTSTTTTSATTSASGDFVTLGLGGVSLSCRHYDAVSDAGVFDVVNSAGGTVTNSSAVITLTIAKSAVLAAQRPLRFWQICYGSPTPFRAIPGTEGTTVIGGTTYYTGLLLSCRKFRAADYQPCLISRTRVWAGGIKLAFVALGDPIYRG